MPSQPPDNFERQFDFTNFSQTQPSAQQPGDKIDLELDEARQSINQTISRLNEIQRDDGKLRDNIFDYTYLNNSVIIAQAARDDAVEAAVLSASRAQDSLYYSQNSAASALAANASKLAAAASALAAANSATASQAALDEFLSHLPLYDQDLNKADSVQFNKIILTHTGTMLTGPGAISMTGTGDLTMSGGDINMTGAGNISVLTNSIVPEGDYGLKVKAKYAMPDTSGIYWETRYRADGMAVTGLVGAAGEHSALYNSYGFEFDTISLTGGRSSFAGTYPKLNLIYDSTIPGPGNEGATSYLSSDLTNESLHFSTGSQYPTHQWDDSSSDLYINANGLSFYSSNVGQGIQMSSTGITFPDATVQTTAFTGALNDYLPLAGGTMTGNIIFGTAGQYIGAGTFDTSRGGSYGLSLVCSVGYEFNWQAGWLTTTEQNSVTPRPLYLDSAAGTTLRAWDSVANSGTEITHTGITSSQNGGSVNIYGDGKIEIIDDNSGLDGGLYITGDNAPLALTNSTGTSSLYVSNTGITFPDLTVQTTAFPFDQSLNSTDNVNFNTLNAIGGLGSFIGADDYSNLIGQTLTLGNSTGYLIVNGSGITFPDATVQQTAYTGPTNPFDQSLNTTDSAIFGGLEIGTLIDLNTSQGLIISNGVEYTQVEAAGITFKDSTIQNTAFPPAGGTTLDYIDGTGALQPFPTGGAATRMETTIFNNTGSTIPAFSVVYINGSHGTLPTVALAKADIEETSRSTFGFTKTSIADQDPGAIIQIGLLEGVNTQAYTDGDLLYVSPTVAGEFTNVQPYSPYHYVCVGTVVRAHPTLGQIQVKVSNSNEFNELSDVFVSTATGGDLLYYNTDLGVPPGWYPVSQSALLSNYLDLGTASTTYQTIAGMSSYALKNSPVFTGNPQAPTPTVGNNTTSLATTEFVTTAIAGVGSGGASVIDIQTFGDSSASSNVVSTWTKPAGAKVIEIHMWGGGGGGAGGQVAATTATRTGGGAGSGSPYCIYRILADDCDETCSVTAGVGGSGGAGSAVAYGGNGSLGTASTFRMKASPLTNIRSNNGINGQNGGSAGVGNTGHIFGLVLTSAVPTAGAGTTSVGGTSTSISGGLLTAGSGGGGSGAIASSVVARAGGAGSSRTAQATAGFSPLLAGGSGGTALGVQATAGSPGDTLLSSGMGGGGGFYITNSNGGTAGTGGYPGGGGGGGGAADTGFTSGSGGKGGNGKVIIITHF